VIEASFERFSFMELYDCRHVVCVLMCCVLEVIFTTAKVRAEANLSHVICYKGVGKRGKIYIYIYIYIMDLPSKIR
jgi:hypothetical protein